jgi:hypothetical protein
MTIDQARTADDLLTALHDVPRELRATALAGRGVTILRQAADLLGASYADTMGKRTAINAVLDNF